MHSIQTKDNKKWCDLANLTNVYNSDNIHHYMIDNESQTLITDTDLSLMTNISLNGCEWKNYVEKCLLKMFFDRRWSLCGVKHVVGKDTNQNISARSLTLLIFAVW